MRLTFKHGKCPVCGCDISAKPDAWTVTTPAGTFCDRHVRHVT